MQFNVFLSGGGLKGAYQYGFFRELYKLHPRFSVKHIYASSVGALNAGPILVKRTDLLDQYWNNLEGKHPFETIVKGWYDYTIHPHKLLLRVLQYNAVFDGIEESSLHDFWDSLNSYELNQVKNKLTIISYDTTFKKPIFFKQFNTSKDLYLSVAASTRHPYLFRQSRLIDGNIVTFNEVVKHAEEKTQENEWLILELGGKKYDGNKYPHVYGPDTNKYNSFSSFTLDNQRIKNLVQEGGQDAVQFFTVLKKMKAV